MLDAIAEEFDGGEFLVGELDGALVAMGGIRPSGGSTAAVHHIRVHPATRRRGYGRLLMAALETSAARLGLSALHLDTASNQPEAMAFYRSLGYAEAGRETQPGWAWTLVYFTKHL